jgi:hypothetical protein
MAKSLPKLPHLLQSKIYKTGQTRGADDDVIYQNRVNRNGTVLIPLDYFDECSTAPDNEGNFENSFIILIKPEVYFENTKIHAYLKEKNLVLGENALLFYETRAQWNKYNPEEKNLDIATSRINPLGGQYVARVPSTTSKTDEKIIHGYSTSGLKGAGIRIYEYASSKRIKDCQKQLEYLYWCCIDSTEVSIKAGMSKEEIEVRKAGITKLCEENGLRDIERLRKARIIDNENHSVCPLCLEKLSANGFLNRLKQAVGRDVPDLTVTQINLFHITELRTGEFNHRPYNLGWGHHHCNVVCKDAGINNTLNWMEKVIKRNKTN